MVALVSSVQVGRMQVQWSCSQKCYVQNFSDFVNGQTRHIALIFPRSPSVRALYRCMDCQATALGEHLLLCAAFNCTYCVVAPSSKLFLVSDASWVESAYCR